MPSDNVELIRRAYEAYSRDDLETKNPADDPMAAMNIERPKESAERRLVVPAVRNPRLELAA
jgi:hypothetical protein